MELSEFEQRRDAGETDFRRSALGQIDLHGVNLSGLDLGEAYLAGANLAAAGVAGVRLSHERSCPMAACTTNDPTRELG